MSIVLILIETNLSDMSADISASSQKSEKQVLALMEEPQVLSHSFLIRQSCAISYEAASKLYTHVYLALEDYSSKYSQGEYDLSAKASCNQCKKYLDVNGSKLLSNFLTVY